jgi:hypothetical protein
MTPWLQGGPFLEISFLHEENRNDRQVVKQILSKIFEIKDIESVEANIDKKISAFENGYFYDEELGIKAHTIQIPLYIDLNVRRKSILTIDRVSSDTLMITFDFYGSVFNSKEWDQIGIAKNDLPCFVAFLKRLFYLFDYKVGGIAFEDYAIGLFCCDSAFPNDCYSVKKITLQDILKEHPGFLVILWNEKYQALENTPVQFERIEQSGILLQVGHFI